MNCKCCQRQVKENSRLCHYHLLAAESVRKVYHSWKEAYSGLSWSEYLNRVKDRQDTGQWVKEVIELGGMNLD
jgi:hypothetical protein